MWQNWDWNPGGLVPAPATSSTFKQAAIVAVIVMKIMCNKVRKLF